MKIAIVSDTHDNTPAVVEIIEYLNAHAIPLCFHAGDIINPGVLRRFIEHYTGHLHFVFGNNDGETALLKQRAHDSKNATCHLTEMQLTVEDRKLFMNHYSSISELVAKSGTFDVCIGGHDHQYRVVPHGNSLFINPGNAVTKDKWLPQGADAISSFVVLDLATLTHEQIVI